MHSVSAAKKKKFIHQVRMEAVTVPMSGAAQDGAGEGIPRWHG
jgi:hypothetical protein